MKKFITTAILLSLLFNLPLFAVVKVEFPGATGLTRCYTATDINGSYWNFSTSTFATWVDKANRAAALVEDAGLGLYQATVPVAIGPGSFKMRCYDMSAATFDPNVTYSGGYVFNWDTLKELTPYAIAVDANKAAGSAGIINTNNDKSGYSLTQAFPANFSVLSITPTTGLVDITQAGADKAWGAASRTLTAGTNISLAKGTGITGFNDVNTSDVSGTLTAYGVPTQAKEDVNHLATQNAIAALPDANDIRDAVFAKTGITAGGTFTFEKITKLTSAWLMGDWHTTDTNGVYNIVDIEDPCTILIQVHIDANHPREVNIP